MDLVVADPAKEGGSGQSLALAGCVQARTRALFVWAALLDSLLLTAAVQGEQASVIAHDRCYRHFSGAQTVKLSARHSDVACCEVVAPAKPAPLAALLTGGRFSTIASP